MSSNSRMGLDEMFAWKVKEFDFQELQSNLKSLMHMETMCT